MRPWNQFSDFLEDIASRDSIPCCLTGIEQGQKQSYATSEVLREIRQLALGLHAFGLPREACVGLIATPSPRWTMIQIAVNLAGAVVVPIFPNISDDNFVFEIEQTSMHWIFVQRDLFLPVFSEHRPLFTHVVDLSEHSTDPDVITYEAIRKRGMAQELQSPHLFEELKQAMRPDSLAAIIYTSGSTGGPKGVELTQHNLLAHLQSHPWGDLSADDRYLSILPLAHIFGFTLNLMMLGLGVPVYYSNDIRNLGKICQELHPTLIAVVPRLLEKIYTKMQTRVHATGFPKRQIGEWAFALAHQEEDSLLKHLVHPIVDKLVYSTLREALGGSLRLVISGGAPLDPHLNHFYQEIGVPIYEGWGMTEGCPITVNTPTKNKIGTVGPPLKGIELKTTPEGEVLVRGSLVMRGYYRNPELTARTIDQEGWLHTGDKGEIDADGFLTLKGRLKELYKTSTGEYVAPIPIEQALCKAPLIECALIIAEGKKFTSCLLFPNKEVMDSLKEVHGMTHLSDEAFLASDFVKREMDQLLRGLNKHLNPWEQVHAYRFIPHPPTIEGGELTPTLKIRRNEVIKKYFIEIESIYLEGANV